jgi:hypothetical protein
MLFKNDFKEGRKRRIRKEDEGPEGVKQGQGQQSSCWFEFQKEVLVPAYLHT